MATNQHYRRYKIKNSTVTIGYSDDFASMAEVIQRRFKKYVTQVNEQQKISSLRNQDFPDLVMIDGGEGQLLAVVNVLQVMNLLDVVKVVSLAKKERKYFYKERVNLELLMRNNQEFNY